MKKQILFSTTIILSLLALQVQSLCVNSTESNGSFGTAQLLPFGVLNNFTSCSGDFDFFVLQNNETILAGQTAYIEVLVTSDTINGNHSYYDSSRNLVAKLSDNLSQNLERVVVQTVSSVSSYYSVINWPSSFWTGFAGSNMDYTIYANRFVCAADLAGATQNTSYDLSYYFDTTVKFRTINIPIQICAFKLRWYKIKVPEFGAISASIDNTGLPADVGYALVLSNSTSIVEASLIARLILL